MRVAVVIGILAGLIISSQYVSAAGTLTCAELAASRWEEGVTAGPEYVDIDAERAIKVCGLEVSKKRSPENLYRFARSLHKAGKLDQALTIGQESLASEYAPAEALVGFMYLSGTPSVKKDYQKAFQSAQRAFEHDFIPAASTLGHILANGLGVEKNETKAVEYFQKGAEMGEPGSQYSLGWYYLNDTTLKQPTSAAIALLNKAAAQQNGQALNLLGVIHESGKHVAENISQATEFYRKASLRGNNDGTTNLARLSEILDFQADIGQNVWEVSGGKIRDSISDNAAVRSVVGLLGEPEIESINPPFYNDGVQLYRARFEEQNTVPIAFYFLRASDTLYSLVGNSKPIQTVNTIHKPLLLNSRQAEQYLWFFTFFLRPKPNDQFQVVRSHEDRLVMSLPNSIREALKSKVTPPACQRADNGNFSCTATIYHKETLVEAEFEIAASGSVSMSNDRPLGVYSGHPIYSPITPIEAKEYFLSLSKQNRLNEDHLLKFEELLRDENQRSDTTKKTPSKLSQSDTIKSIQTYLSSADCGPGPIDGLWGKGTESAYKYMMSQRNIEPHSCGKDCLNEILEHISDARSKKLSCSSVSKAVAVPKDVSPFLYLKKVSKRNTVWWCETDRKGISARMYQFRDRWMRELSADRRPEGLKHDEFQYRQAGYNGFDAWSIAPSRKQLLFDGDRRVRSFQKLEFRDSNNFSARRAYRPYGKPNADWEYESLKCSKTTAQKLAASKNVPWLAKQDWPKELSYHASYGLQYGFRLNMLITHNCGTSKDIVLTMSEYLNGNYTGLTRPNDGKEYVLDYPQKRKLSIPCATDTLMCYSAKSKEGNAYWGLNPKIHPSKATCRNCCAACERAASNRILIQLDC